VREAAAATGLADAIQVQSLPGLMTVFFSDRPVRDYAAARACDTDAYGAWCRALLELGVYPPPSQFEAWFPSLAHGEAEVSRTVEAARTAFERVARR
jgi:glutamate-1-semialdehyde 2,1-aminomutase